MIIFFCSAHRRAFRRPRRTCVNSAGDFLVACTCSIFPRKVVQRLDFETPPGVGFHNVRAFMTGTRTDLDLLKGQDGQPRDWVAVKVQKPAVAKFPHFHITNEYSGIVKKYYKPQGDKKKLTVNTILKCSFFTYILPARDLSSHGSHSSETSIIRRDFSE